MDPEKNIQKLNPAKEQRPTFDGYEITARKVDSGLYLKMDLLKKATRDECRAKTQKLGLFEALRPALIIELFSYKELTRSLLDSLIEGKKMGSPLDGKKTNPSFDITQIKSFLNDEIAARIVTMSKEKKYYPTDVLIDRRLGLTSPKNNQDIDDENAYKFLGRIRYDLGLSIPFSEKQIQTAIDNVDLELLTLAADCKNDYTKMQLKSGNLINLYLQETNPNKKEKLEETVDFIKSYFSSAEFPESHIAQAIQTKTYGLLKNYDLTQISKNISKICEESKEIPLTSNKKDTLLGAFLFMPVTDNNFHPLISFSQHSMSDAALKRELEAESQGCPLIERLASYITTMPRQTPQEKAFHNLCITRFKDFLSVGTEIDYAWLLHRAVVDNDVKMVDAILPSKNTKYENWEELQCDHNQPETPKFKHSQLLKYYVACKNPEIKKCIQPHLFPESSSAGRFIRSTVAKHSTINRVLTSIVPEKIQRHHAG